MICLAKDFDPSIIAADRPGPKHAMPAERTASATPAASGASGPITTRPAPVCRASRQTSAGSVGEDLVRLGQPRGARVARGRVQARHVAVAR
jgi:hypothetical protein